MADLVPMLVRTIGEQSAQISCLANLSLKLHAVEERQEEMLRIISSLAAFTTATAAAQRQARGNEDFTVPEVAQASEEEQDRSRAEKANDVGAVVGAPRAVPASMMPALPDGCDNHYFLSHVSALCLNSCV